MKIITFGGATRDIFIHYESAQTLEWSSKQEIKSFLLLQEGTKVEISSIEYSTGGGATNSATSFKRLGFDVTTIIKVGKDEQGSAILTALAQEDIDVYECPKSEISTGISYIIPSAHGDNTVLAFRGANAHIALDEFPFEALTKTDALYITSLSKQSAHLLLPVTKYAKEHDVFVANNPGISQLSSGITTLQASLPFIDVFILNSDEAQRFMIALSTIIKTNDATPTAIQQKSSLPRFLITSKENKSCFNIIQYFKTIEALGPKIIVVTDGAHGVYVYSKNSMYYHPSLSIKVINTLGAGDAFGSCFFASLLQKHSIEQAIMHGLLNSTSVISYLDAKTGLLTKDELKKESATIDFSLLQKFTFQ